MTRQRLRALQKGYVSHEVSKNAAALTYYLAFAIFPLIILVSSILGMLHLPELSPEQDLASLLPTNVIEMLNTTITHMTQASNGTLLAFGVVFTFWLPFRAVKHLLTIVAQIYGQAEGQKRKVLRSVVLAVVLAVFVPLLLLVLILGRGVLDILSTYIPLADSLVQFLETWVTVRFLPVAVALFLLISLIYRLSPEKHPRWRAVLPGAFVATLCWVGFSYAFAYYVDHMGEYSLIYGSIGAIVAALVWLNMSVHALLLGAVYNAVREVA